MTKIFEVPIRPQSSILGTYRNQSYKIEGVISEFIDNSTQSFFDHRNDLKSKCEQDKVTVKIDIFQNEIKIVDDAFGMNIRDFNRAFKLDSPPEDTSGRNEKGMGLKTAATWLGNIWSVQTVELGSGKLLSAEINLNDIRENAPDSVSATEEECDRSAHYTIITIKELNRGINKIGASQINRLIRILSKMYSVDISVNQDVEIFINKNKLAYEQPPLWKDPETGEAYRKDFALNFYFDGKEYAIKGWAGIVKTAMTDGAGFTLLRKGRGIKTGYRPKAIFGGPNSYPYQRIIGDIEMVGSSWEISHAKDSFLWDTGLEETMLECLKENLKDLIRSAITLRVNKNTSTPDAKRKIAKQTEKRFKSISKEIEQEEDIQPSVSVISPEEKKEIYLFDSEIDNSGKTVINIPYRGKEYKFLLEESLTRQRNWIDIKLLPEDKSVYVLSLDFNFPLFEKFSSDARSYEVLQTVSVSIALALAVSQNDGMEQWDKFLTILNQILRTMK